MEMKRGSLIVAFVVLMSAFYATLTTIPETVKATTLFVGGGGPGNYTTIQDAINASNTGDTVYVYNGVYYEDVVIDRALTLIGEDTNTTSIDGGGFGTVVNVTGDWVNITGFTITNSGKDSGFDWVDVGLGLRFVSKCNISGNNLSSNDGGGVFLYYSNDNIIANNSASWSAEGFGIGMRNSDNNMIINNTAYWNTRREGIYIGSSSKGNIVINNIVAYNRVGIAIRGSRGIIATGNTMSEDGMFLDGFFIEDWNTHFIDASNTINGRPVFYQKNVSGLKVPANVGQVILGNCDNATVEDMAFNNSYIGLIMGYSPNTTIANNSFTRHEDGLISVFSNDVVIDNNNFSENWNGMKLINSQRAVISNNTGYSYRDTIELAATHDSLITNNTMSKQGLGIRSTYSMRNVIVGNNISDKWDAILLDGGRDNIIIGNTISSNNGIGIRLYYSDGNQIMMNTVSNNGLNGFFLEESDNNEIYHNNIIGNTQQAYDNTNTNRWDNGYPSGGNYWADYIGFDIMSGSGQNLPGSDGIGDTPYVIDADSRDRYPLMSALNIRLPRPPKVVGATLSGQNSENVTIKWQLSPEDGFGFGFLTGYLIYRNTTYNPDGLGYSPIASLPGGTSAFVDILAGEGNTSNYFYRVCATGLYNTSCAIDQVGKLTRPLSKGPNLVSIPLIQSDETLQTVLQTVSYDNAWSYDPINQEWKSFSKSKPYSQSLEYLNHTMGIWVNATQDSNLTVAGVVPTSTTIDLQAGWNLVGFPSFDDNYTVADLKATIAVERIEGYDGSAPPYFLRVMADADFLQAGFGYWIRVESPAIWTVENT